MFHHRVPFSLLLIAASGCSAEVPFQEVTVRGSDYAFVGPDTIPPGLTAFSFENTGRVRHEMGVTLLRPGVTLAEVVLADSLNTPDDSLYGTDGGVLFAEPGEWAGGRLLVELLPNRMYLLWCDFRDAPDAFRHSELGMLRILTVR